MPNNIQLAKNILRWKKTEFVDNIEPSKYTQEYILYEETIFNVRCQAMPYPD